VKKYINLFKSHIFDKEHPINIINKYFIKEFSYYVKEKIKTITADNHKESEIIMQALELESEVTNSLQKYIVKLQSSIRLMYARCMNYQCFLEERDDFINLMTNLVFSEEILYRTIYQLFELTLLDQRKLFEGKLKEFSNILPEDLGIQDKFCLNEKTFELQKKMLKEKKEKEALNNKDNIIANQEEKQLITIPDNSLNSNVTFDKNDLRSSLISNDKNSKNEEIVLK